MNEIKKHFRLFVASPGDVGKERDAVEDVVKKFNLQNDYGIHIDVIRWEDYATPNWGHPQDVIFDNTEFDKADLFVAIFWARMGTPSGKTNPDTGKEYVSGTMEEIEAALRLFKDNRLNRIMTYFCTREVLHKTSKDAEQHAKVLEYREFLDNQHKALYKLFDSTDNFKFKFQNDLIATLKKLKLLAESRKNRIPNSEEINVGTIHVINNQIAQHYSYNFADVRFSITNLTENLQKIPKLLLKIVERNKINKTRLKKAGAILQEFQFHAKIHKSDEIDLLKDTQIQLVLDPKSTEAFRVKLEGDEGFFYKCLFLAHFHDLETGSQRKVIGPHFQVEFPIHNIEVLRRRQKKWNR